MNKYDVPVVILAGGRGSRLYGHTASLPKPLTPIGGKPVLWHIMKIYSHYGYNNFIVAGGYKINLLEKWLETNFNDFGADISIVDTGVDTMTGGRLKRLERLLGDRRFMLTYGDGVADINIDALMEAHNKSTLSMTVTAVHPPARFGELVLDSDVVISYSEKPMQASWINGGFFVCDPEIFEYLYKDSDVLEQFALMEMSKTRQLAGYRHEKFWACLDTPRDLESLQTMWATQAPWKVWKDDE